MPTDSLVQWYPEFDNPDDWNKYYPFTLSITSNKGQPYSQIIMPTYDRDSNIVKKGMDWEVQLASPVYVNTELTATVEEDIITGKI